MISLKLLVVALLSLTITTAHPAANTKNLPTHNRRPIVHHFPDTQTRRKPRAMLTLENISRVMAIESCVQTCGSTCYYQSDITAALNKGYSLYQSGKTLGSSHYPHQYSDNEGFQPYRYKSDSSLFEFPILNTYEVYGGGSAGADRVLFNGEGELKALLTHTGAGEDGFLECRPGSKVRRKTLGELR